MKRGTDENMLNKVWFNPSLPFDEWKVDFLIDYIINIHHRYIYQSLPELQAQLQFLETKNVHNDQLNTLKNLVSDLASILLAHCRHEEEIIFPYIKQIDTAHKRNETYGNLFVKTLRKPLNNVENEHGRINVLLEKLKGNTNNFMTGDRSYPGKPALFIKLREFHHNLLLHEMIENNYLFPRAVDIEGKLLRV